MSNELVNLNFCNETVELKSTIENSFLDLGSRLRKIRDESLYKPQWETFAVFVEEMKMSETAASKLINIYQKFVLEYQIPTEKLLQAGGWSVIAEVLPVVHSKADAEEMLEKAIVLTRDDLRREIKEKRTGVEQRECTHDDTYALRICRLCGDRQRVDE